MAELGFPETTQGSVIHQEDSDSAVLSFWPRIAALKGDRAEADKEKALGGFPRKPDTSFQVLRVGQVLHNICEMMMSALPHHRR